MRGALHFVGFKGEEVLSALRVWGRPDFWHRLNDERSRAEMMDGDTVVYANGSEVRRAPHAYDDSRYH